MKQRMKHLSTVLTAFTFAIFNSVSVLATETEAKEKKGGLTSTKLYTGTLQLIKDAQTAMLAIEAVFIVALLIWNGIKMQAAEQEEKPKHKKHMIQIAIIGIVIIAMTGLVPVILGYYQ